MQRNTTAPSYFLPPCFQWGWMHKDNKIIMMGPSASQSSLAYAIALPMLQGIRAYYMWEMRMYTDWLIMDSFIAWNLEGWRTLSCNQSLYGGCALIFPTYIRPAFIPLTRLDPAYATQRHTHTPCRINLKYPFLHLLCFLHGTMTILYNIPKTLPSHSVLKNLTAAQYYQH